MAQYASLLRPTTIAVAPPPCLFNPDQHLKLVTKPATAVAAATDVSHRLVRDRFEVAASTFRERKQLVREMCQRLFLLLSQVAEAAIKRRVHITDEQIRHGHLHRARHARQVERDNIQRTVPPEEILPPCSTPDLPPLLPCCSLSPPPHPPT